MRTFLIGFAIVVGASVAFIFVMWALMHLMEWMFENIFFGEKEDR